MRSIVALVLFAAASSASAECLSPGWAGGSILDRSADRVLTADLTGDARPDLIGHTASTIFVALNDGNGTLATATDVHTIHEDSGRAPARLRRGHSGTARSGAMSGYRFSSEPREAEPATDASRS